MASKGFKFLWVAPRLPKEEEGGRQIFFDTVGYPIEACWLL